jgi:hypothetical protein
MWYRKEDAEGDRIERDSDVFELARDTVGVAGLGKLSALPALAIWLRMQGGGRGTGMFGSEIAVMDRLVSSSEIELNSCGAEHPDSLLVGAMRGIFRHTLSESRVQGQEPNGLSYDALHGIKCKSRYSFSIQWFGKRIYLSLLQRYSVVTFKDPRY